MISKTLSSIKANHNLERYDEIRSSHQWSDVEKTFSWNTTGLVNMGHEAIDRHANTEKGNKVALYYSDQNREEKYTFKEMKDSSNKAGNVLKDIGVTKGDRVFIFMPRSPELYFVLLGTIKIGAIVGPLFEAFMEGAVKDRLEDSGAKVLVTTPELIGRVPVPFFYTTF